MVFGVLDREEEGEVIYTKGEVEVGLLDIVKCDGALVWMGR